MTAVLPSRSLVMHRVTTRRMKLIGRWRAPPPVPVDSGAFGSFSEPEDVMPNLLAVIVAGFALDRARAVPHPLRHEHHAVAQVSGNAPAAETGVSATARL